MNDRLPEPEIDEDYECPYCNNVYEWMHALPDEVDGVLLWRCAHCACVIAINDLILIEVYA